jgi:hypothetical protein
MKRVFLLAVLVALTSAWTGCNRGWPSCFCRDNDCGDYAVSDTCVCQPEVCEPTSTRYGASTGAVEFVQPAIPTPAVESLPSPGPVTSTSPAR